ncbi:beta strand repeat-containing protein [Luteolibacter arcticus]|nr:autotransporter-associated beta strand repeat-containing protein [Luteolibacter arcticus]
MNIRTSLLISASMLALATPSTAAQMTWGAPATIAGESDVSTTGTLVSAYSFFNGASTVNGVAFANGSGTNLGTYFQISAAGATYNGFGAGAAGTAYANLTAGYKTLLANGRYNVKNSTVSLKSLTPGHQYAVQVWSNDSRAATGSPPSGAYVTLNAANSVNLPINGTGLAGGVGTHSIGLFVADNATQTFTAGSSWGDCYLNAIQLRDLGLATFSTAGYWNGTGGATWDAATTASWSLNDSTAPLSSGNFAAAMSASTGVATFSDLYYDNGATVPVTQNLVTIAAGGVSCTTANFPSSAIAYILNGADATGLTGGTALSKSGSSMLTLAGANTHTGATTIESGSIRLGNASSLGSSPVTVSLANGLSFAAGIGTFTLGNLAGSGGLALTDTAAAAVTMKVGNGSNTSYGGNLSGAGAGLTKQGGGTLTMTGGCSLTGQVAVNEGTLSTQGPAADGVFPNAASVTINNGGTLASGSNGLFGYNNHPVPVTVNAGGLLTVNGGANGGPNMFGSLTLAGGTVAEDNSVHGTYGSYNFGGASIIATGATTSALSARDFQFRNSATTVQVDAGSTLNVTGYFTGLAHAAGKALNKTGAGKLILASSTASSHGATNVNEGTLELTGAHGTGKITVATGATLAGTGTAGGVVEVQANGVLTTADNVIEDLTLNSSATLAGTTALEITKDGGIPVADLVFILSGVTYGGTLSVTNITSDSTGLTVGDSFKLFDALSYSGGFTTFNLPALPAGLSWDRSTLTSNGTISVINNVSSPVFTPPGGGYAGAQSVTISSDSGSTIYYTVDGSTPGPSSPNGPSPVSGITVPTNSSMTVKAYAVKAGQGNSTIATALYTTVTTPTWTEVFGGNWSDGETANWLSGVVGNGAGVTADFSTLTLDGDSLVSLSDARSIGHLRFGDVGNAYQWTLGGSELALAGTSPSITVNNQRTIISAPLAGNAGMRKEGGGILRLAANEDYTGNTVVNGGTLELAGGAAAYTNSTLQGTLTVNGGATCSLASSTALGWGGGVTDIYLNGGELTGTGAMALGVSYHLTGGSINATGLIRLGVLTGFPDVTLTSSSSATTSVINAEGLSLTGIFGQTSLPVTVAQGTTSTGIDLQINAPISGGYSLVKGGAGNLLLAGTNTYSGATTVNEGTLTINGSVSSATTINGTATLAGTGTATGGATIGATAFVAPGGSTTGELHGGATTIDGTYQCQLGGVAYDRLTITGNLTFAATSTIAVSGEATEDAYVIASYTGTLSGTPQVTGIPEGYALDLNTPNQVRIVQATGYSDWASQWADGQGMNLDFDGDGVANGIEYFMGETGVSFTAGPSMAGKTVSWSKGASYVGTYGVDYWIETSSTLSLAGWSVVLSGDPNLTNGSPLQFTLPAGQPRIFTRLVVTGP